MYVVCMYVVCMYVVPTVPMARPKASLGPEAILLPPISPGKSLTLSLGNLDSRLETIDFNTLLRLPIEQFPPRLSTCFANHYTNQARESPSSICLFVYS